MTPEQQQFWTNQGIAVLAWAIFLLFLYRQGWPFIKDQIVMMQSNFRQEMDDRKNEIALLIANNQAQRDSHLASERQARADYLASLDTIRTKQDIALASELKELRIAVIENTKTMHEWLSNREWDGEKERRRKPRQETR